MKDNDIIRILYITEENDPFAWVLDRFFASANIIFSIILTDSDSEITRSLNNTDYFRSVVVLNSSDNNMIQKWLWNILRRENKCLYPFIALGYEKSDDFLSKSENRVFKERTPYRYVEKPFSIYNFLDIIKNVESISNEQELSSDIINYNFFGLLYNILTFLHSVLYPFSGLKADLQDFQNLQEDIDRLLRNIVDLKIKMKENNQFIRDFIKDLEIYKVDSCTSNIFKTLSSKLEEFNRHFMKSSDLYGLINDLHGEIKSIKNKGNNEISFYTFQLNEILTVLRKQKKQIEDELNSIQKA